MLSALRNFKDSLLRARDLAGLFASLSAQTTGVLDASDLLRSSIVLGVSAFDYYVHEIARIGMIEISRGSRAQTDASRRFAVRLGNVAAGHDWLDAEIREKHGWLSFQQPDKVAEAIRLVSARELWKEVGLTLGRPAAEVKAQLTLLVDRRNKIAHEADLDPTSPGARWPIDVAVVDEALVFLDKIAKAMYNVVCQEGRRTDSATRSTPSSTTSKRSPRRRTRGSRGATPRTNEP